jgi:hypothetical protein
MAVYENLGRTLKEVIMVSTKVFARHFSEGTEVNL